MKLSSSLVACSFLVLSLAGCMWETKLSDDAAAIHVERGRELLITNDAVLSALSSSAADGPLSFRRAMTRLSMREPSMLTWMRGWSRRLRDEGEGARADALESKITCPWLRRTAANECSASCATCAGEVLRLEDAPFRLIAVANRTDLSVLPDRAAAGGEGRLVFALTDGPADAVDSRPLAFTVIVEYAQEGSARDWASRWHALGAVSEEAFPAKLAEVAGGFVEKGTLAQIRSADAVTGSLVLHEFHLESGELVAKNVRNTPDWRSVSEAEVRTFASDQSDAIENGTHLLPASWWAGSSSLHAGPPPYLASVTSHDALLRGTCGGCHQTTESGFQIDPLARGDQKLSRFLLDPSKELDEAGRRTQWMQVTLSRR